MKTHSHLSTARRGNLLVGCGVVLAIIIILAIAGGIFVAMNLRSWTASASTALIDGALTEAQIDPVEHKEIMTHVEGLMTKFKDKDIGVQELGQVMEEFTQSPLLPAALTTSIDNYYIANSTLDETEQTQARTDLARFAQGLFEDAIEPEVIAPAIDPLVTLTPDNNDIQLNLTLDDGTKITALRSNDEVTDDELRTVIANLKAHADEANITQTPTPIDLSDEVAKVIAIALGEIPDPTPNGEITPPNSTDDTTPSDTTSDDSNTDTDPTQPDPSSTDGP